MAYETLYLEFCNAVNDYEMLKLLETKFDVDNEDGVHVLFCMVVVPYILMLLKNGDDDKLRMAFEFFEKMARSEEEAVGEVLDFSVLEPLASDDKIILSKCKKYMLKETLLCCEEAEKFML